VSLFQKRVFQNSGSIDFHFTQTKFSKINHALDMSESYIKVKAIDHNDGLRSQTSWVYGGTPDEKSLPFEYLLEVN
jgi:hypothetical protein